MDIDALAERLFAQIPVAKPQWSQLGDITKSVWRERAQAQQSLSASPAALEVEAARPPPITQDEQTSLF